MNQENQEQNEQTNYQARIEKTYNYFYKITNLINGKYYYGIHSTNKLDDGYMGGGVMLNYAIKKYGKENFKKEIIANYSTRTEASNHEREVVNYNIINLEECYNLRPGGDNDFVYDDNHRLQRSIKNTEVMQRQHLRDQISNKLKGIKVPIDVIQKRVKNFSRRIICEVDGVIYNTLSEVKLKFGIENKIIKFRCNSDDAEWQHWKILNSEQLIKNKRAHQIKHYYIIDGIRYNHYSEITKIYEIDYFCIRYRCKSNLDKYKNWMIFDI